MPLLTKTDIEVWISHGCFLGHNGRGELGAKYPPNPKSRQGRAILTWKGKLLHIHIAKAGGEPMNEVQTASLQQGIGIEGDRYATGNGKYSPFPDIREITLIENETLIALKRDHEVDLVPGEHRRNLTTENVPLNHLVGKRFWVGSVLLEGGRLNTPCRYLDLITKKSVYEFLKHRSGLNCSIVKSGMISTGDLIRPV